MMSVLLMECSRKHIAYYVRVDMIYTPHECPYCGERFILHKNNELCEAFNRNGRSTVSKTKRRSVRQGIITPICWDGTKQAIISRRYAWECLMVQSIEYMKKYGDFSKVLRSESSFKIFMGEINRKDSLQKLYSYLYEIATGGACNVEWVFDSDNVKVWNKIWIERYHRNIERELISSFRAPQEKETVITTIDRKNQEIERKVIKKQSGIFTEGKLQKEIMRRKIFVERIGEVCLLCGEKVRVEDINIPVYNQGGEYEGCYVCKVRTCDKCEKHFLSHEEVVDFTRRIAFKTKGKLTHDLYIKTSNTSPYRICSTAYLDAEVTKQVMKIDMSRKIEDVVEIYSEDGGLGLKPQSFLSKMGYGTGKSTNERRNILREAVAIYGKRRILDHLEFLIRMRKNQQSRDYTEAIEVWEADIKYTINDI